MRLSAKFARGRVKEAAGTLVNNKDLRARGQGDPAMGRLVNTANDGTQQAINRPRGECSVFQSNM